MLDIGSAPQVIAAGTLNGTAGTPAITATGLYKCSTPVSSAKGVYTIVLETRPTTLLYTNNYCLLITSGAASTTCAATAYNATTGVLTFTSLTSDTKAANENVVVFAILQTSVG